MQPKPQEVIRAVEDLVGGEELVLPDWVVPILRNRASVSLAGLLSGENPLDTIKTAFHLVFYAGVLAREKGWELPYGGKEVKR